MLASGRGAEGRCTAVAGGASSATLPRCGRPRPLHPASRRAAPCRAAAKDRAPPLPAAQPPLQPPPRSRLAGLLSWRSSAQTPAAEQAKTMAAAPEAGSSRRAAADVAQHQQHQQAPTAAEQQQQPSGASSGRFSVYSWLTWGSGSTIPAEPAVAAGSQDAAELGDGMAAVPAAPPAPRRSWLSRRSLASSFSSLGSWDDTEAAAAAAAAETQRQVQHAARAGHPALQLLRSRVLEGSRPGARRDPFKLGLVVEGGGMRGCVSGGALQALADLGMQGAFDAVYGSSAGAINSTFFLSGQRTGVQIYHDHIACQEFIDLRRLWSRQSGEGPAKPVLDLSFLIDHVMHSVHPLDWDAVLASPLPLKVVASSLDTLDSVLLDDFECKRDLAECLKASATVPEIAGGPRLHRGQRLVDAAVFQPVPFKSAIADGCTHLLVLCTRPTHLTRRSRVNATLADAVEVAIKRAVLSPDYMRPAWRAELEQLARDGLAQDDQLLQALAHPAAHELPWFAGAHVYPLYPGSAANFSPLCTDPTTLKAGVAEGRANVITLARALFGAELPALRAMDELAAALPLSTAAASSNIVPASPGAGRGIYRPSQPSSQPRVQRQ